MSNNGPIRFGVFELDLAARELRKRGVRVKLQDQPFRVLEALVEKPGEIVTREQLKDRLWAQDEFVEFDKSLNTAVQKIRQALSDSAESPRFLETIPRVGYKFIAPISAAAAPEPESAKSEPPKPRTSRSAYAPAGIALLVGVGLGVWLSSSPSPPPEARTQRFRVHGDLMRFSRPFPSPDGRYIAWCDPLGSLSQKHPVVLWDIERGAARTLTVETTAQRLFWSPDGRRLGMADGSEIVVADMASEAVRTLTSWPEPPTWSGSGASWSPDGETIIFSTGPGFENYRLYQVSAAGGAPQLLFEPEEDDPDRLYGFFDPHFLPGRRRALLYAQGVPNSSDIGYIDLNTLERRTLVSGPQPYRSPVLAPSGHVVYQESTGHAEWSERVWALPFSLEQGEATGDPFVIAESGRWPAVTSNGMLTYLDVGEPGLQQLVFRDRNGRRVGEIGEPQASISMPVLSPEGDQVVVLAFENDMPDIWIHETERTVKRRVTFDRTNNDRPTWLPSGREVTFSSFQTGLSDIYVAAADGSGQQRLLFGSPTSDFGFDWSSDGRYLVGSGSGSLWYLRRNDDGEWEKVVLGDRRFRHVSPELSPDGRYLAFESHENGRAEVWVRAFPEGPGKWLVSPDGGAQPRWKGDASELFYVQDDTLMAVPVTLEPEFVTGLAVPLFEGHGVFAGRGQRYDVTADGERFVVVESIEQPGDLSIQVVLNWYEEFREERLAE